MVIIFMQLMVHCGVTSSGTQSSGLTMQSQRRERERANQHQYNWNEFQYGCLQPPNKSVSAYHNNKAMSLQGKLLSLPSLSCNLPAPLFLSHHACSSLAGVLFSLTIPILSLSLLHFLHPFIPYCVFISFPVPRRRGFAVAGFSCVHRHRWVRRKC